MENASPETCDGVFIPSSVGDGICNDEMNNANCSYDHGDCCLSNKDYGGLISRWCLSALLKLHKRFHNACNVPK